jgi:hypothetical protein
MGRIASGRMSRMMESLIFDMAVDFHLTYLATVRRSWAPLFNFFLSYLLFFILFPVAY